MSQEHTASAEFWQSRWPYDAEKVEMTSGCPVWSGGPYDARDVEAAERAFPEHRAVVGEDGYGLTLVPRTWRWRVRIRPSAVISGAPPEQDAPVTISWHADRASAESAVRAGSWAETLPNGVG